MKNVSLLTCCLGLLFLSCDGNHYTGTDEQTNTIAGIVRDSLGNALAGVAVEVRTSNSVPAIASLVRVQSSTITVTVVENILTDTTDSQGQWSVFTQDSGAFTVVMTAPDGRTAIHQVNLDDSVHLSDTVYAPLSLSLDLATRWGAANTDLVLLGTRFRETSDSLGHLEFTGLPRGTYTAQLFSPDEQRYAETRWRLYLDDASATWQGPFYADDDLDSLKMEGSTEILAASDKDTLALPLIYSYDVRAWWEFDELQQDENLLTFYDSRGITGTGVAYNASLITGVWDSAISLDGSSQFGVVEDVGTAFDSLQNFSVEAWVLLDSLPSATSYQYNLVGQLGFGTSSADLFSLALAKDSGSDAHFAFLLSDGQSTLDTSRRVMATQNAEAGEWIYLAATWDGTQACLYVDGELTSCRELTIDSLYASTEAIYFGKEDLGFALDETRIIGINLDQTDVQYRWLRRFP